MQGLLIAARAVEQGREFLDPAVLEKADGLGARGGRQVLACAVPIVGAVARLSRNQYWRCSNG